MLKLLIRLFQFRILLLLHKRFEKQLLQSLNYVRRHISPLNHTIFHLNRSINKSKTMKSILDRLKNHAAQSLRLIIICVNGTARFRVAYSSLRNHRLFFLLHYPSHSSETVGRQKMGALVWAGGYSNLQGEMNESQKSIHGRT